MQILHSHVILDACCILNFCASGHLLEILQAIPAQVVVTQVVKDELKTLQRLENEENEGASQFEIAIDQSLLIVVDFESEEEAGLFIDYATVLDDGESACCAIASHRGWAIATDDKRAISFIQREISQLQIISTPEIIKHWSEKVALDASVLGDALRAIRVKGRYLPRKNHPLLSWWQAALTDPDALEK